MTGVAEAFLAGGVANFLGTHWPVGDDAALAFSQELYGALLGGETLGESVLAARRRIEALPSIDWADYVHYGSPEFRLLHARSNARSTAEPCTISRKTCPLRMHPIRVLQCGNIPGCTPSQNR